jgi:hypothetical protein
LVMARIWMADTEPNERFAQTWLATMPELGSATDQQLLSWLETFPPRQAASMKRLLQFSALAGAPRGLLDRVLARPGIPPGLANRIVGGTGDVDSPSWPSGCGRSVAWWPAT